MPLDKTVVTFLAYFAFFSAIVWTLGVRSKNPKGVRAVVNILWSPNPTPRCVWWMVPTALVLMGAAVLLLVIPNL